MERVSHHGRETAYTRSDRDGDGPGLLCVHGSGGSAAVWKGQHRLADAFPVTALDLSGHGESDDVDAAAGYEALWAYTEDVAAVAEASDSRVLCGNSLGGAVAMWAVLQDEVDVDGLVLVGTGAKLAVLADLLDWLAHDFDQAVEFLHGPDRLLHTDDERYVEASAEAMRETGRAVAERDYRTCHAFDIRGRLGDIDVPAVAVVGEYDKLTPRRYHEYLAEELPDCDLEVIEDAAHLAMLEQPEAFNRVVADFVDRIA